MNCSQFGQVVHDVDRTGALNEPLQAEALGHADECASCAVLLDRVRMLNASLRELAKEDRVAQAPARVERGLRTIFRHRRAMEAHARAWRRWTWAGAAAVIVATVATMLTLRRDSKPFTPAVAHAPAQTNSPAIQEQLQTDHKQEARNTRRPAHDSDAESAEEFVPLPDSLPLLPAEEASVVRVRLRRGSLSAFGLMVNEERAADLIQVDFLVAEDGTPRAVRYVR